MLSRERSRIHLDDRGGRDLGALAHGGGYDGGLGGGGHGERGVTAAALSPALGRRRGHDHVATVRTHADRITFEWRSGFCICDTVYDH